VDAEKLTHAETLVRQVLAREDATADEINDAAAMLDLAEAETKRLAPNLPGAALWYASQGLRVFPLQAGSKIPRPGSRGFKDATSDPAIIEQWWSQWPDANIGIATGHLVEVIDIDGAAGQHSRAKHWYETFGAVDAACVGKVSTPRLGGMHIYMAATGATNKQHLYPSIDIRGIGGYVVAPPSVTPDGTYLWLAPPKLDELASQGGDAA